MGAEGRRGSIAAVGMAVAVTTTVMAAEVAAGAGETKTVTKIVISSKWATKSGIITTTIITESATMETMGTTEGRVQRESIVDAFRLSMAVSKSKWERGGYGRYGILCEDYRSSEKLVRFIFPVYSEFIMNTVFTSGCCRFITLSSSDNVIRRVHHSIM